MTGSRSIKTATTSTSQNENTDKLGQRNEGDDDDDDDETSDNNEKIERQHQQQSSFSLSKYSHHHRHRNATKYHPSTAPNTSKNGNAKQQEGDSKSKSHRKKQQQQQLSSVIPIPSFRGVNAAFLRENDAKSVLAKIEQALRIDVDDTKVKSVSLKRTTTTTTTTTNTKKKKSNQNATIPIPKFSYCVDDHDVLKDDDDEQDCLLAMKPIFRKQQQQQQQQQQQPPKLNPPSSATPVPPTTTKPASSPSAATMSDENGKQVQDDNKSSQQMPSIVVVDPHQPPAVVVPTYTNNKSIKGDHSTAAAAAAASATTTTTTALSLRDLLATTDSIFHRFNPQTATLKSILTALENTVGMKLNHDQRRAVKDHVIHHHLDGGGDGDGGSRISSGIGSTATSEKKKPSKAVKEIVGDAVLLEVDMPNGKSETTSTKDKAVEPSSDSLPNIHLPQSNDPPKSQGKSSGQGKDGNSQQTHHDFQQQKQQQQQPQQQPQPSLKALKDATEYLYGLSDPNTNMQEVVEAMESFLGVTLSAASQKLVEQHWAILKQNGGESQQQQPQPPPNKHPSDTIEGVAAVPLPPPPHSALTTASAMSAMTNDDVAQERRKNSSTIANTNFLLHNNPENHQRRMRTTYGTTAASNTTTTTTHGKSHTSANQQRLPVILEEETPVVMALGGYAPTKVPTNVSPFGGVLAEEYSVASSIRSTLTSTSSNLVDLTNGNSESKVRRVEAITKTLTGEPIAGTNTSRPAVAVRKRPWQNATATSFKTNESAAPTTRNRKRPRKDSCALCSNCPCSNHRKDDQAMSALDLSRSEADMEKALWRRMAKLERTTESYVQQKEYVKRELKKLRRKIFKRQVAKLGLEKAKPFGDSYFLPDAKTWEETFQGITSSTASLPPATVAKAKSKLYAPGGQPTLTQMLGRPEKPQSDGQEISVILECADEVENNSIAAESDNPLDDEKSVQDEPDDASMTEYEDIKEEECQAAGVVHRITWKCGCKSPVVSSSSIRGAGVWSAVAVQPNSCGHRPDGYACSWDGLFAKLTDNDPDGDGDGIEKLVDMFDGVSSTAPDEPTADHLSPSTLELADKSLLSQHSRDLVEVVEGMIEDHTEKRLAVESLCDNWRENIVYAFTRDKSEVVDALENIKESKERLKKTVAAIMEACQRREALLDLYEQSLEKALERLQAKSAMADDDDIVPVVDMPCSPQIMSREKNMPHTPSSSCLSPSSSTSSCRLERTTHQNLGTSLEMESIVSS